MEKCEYPSVYVVDTNTTRPPVPPRLGYGQRKHGVAQTLLFLLVSLALCGMVIEACFIFKLYHSEYTTTSPESAKLSSDKDNTATTKRPSHGILPSKPVAHLTDGQDVVHGKHVMGWSMNAEPLLYKMGYKDKELIIQKEGYYYVYSKVFFSDHDMFHHYIKMHTEKYLGGNITLLQSRKYSPSSHKLIRSNSYLGGVFHLYEKDAIFVEVSSTARIERHKSYENVFGAYMI